MLVKVCGITNEEQYMTLMHLGVDMIGFNFYPLSKRFLEQKISGVRNATCLNVGVFVNPTEKAVEAAVLKHALDFVQLHGNENAEFCHKLSKNYKLIKAFGVDEAFDFEITEPYEDYVEYFLFDTKTSLYGGSGKKFDWTKLAHYNGKKPFLLSGGISLQDAEEISNQEHNKLAGVDINSGFETSPGLKNIELVKQFLSLIK